MFRNIIELSIVHFRSREGSFSFKIVLNHSKLLKKSSGRFIFGIFEWLFMRKSRIMDLEERNEGLKFKKRVKV